MVLGSLKHIMQELYRDHGKENGNYYRILGFYRDNGEETGNCYSILGLYRVGEW